LGQSAKKISGNKNHPEHQDALIEPACHTTGQTGSLKLNVHLIAQRPFNFSVKERVQSMVVIEAAMCCD
jgi:hypothetical protein